MGHGATLNKVRNVEAMYERSASKFLLKCKPLETMRTAALSSVVHDDVFNYSPPSDFASLIDLIPQDSRSEWDMAFRDAAGLFDLQKAVKNRTVSIEGSEGSKIIRINWRSRQGKVLSGMNDTDDNGTWSAVTGASNVEQDTIFKKSGGASVRFDLTSTGGGIQNTTLDALDLTDEDEVADVFVWVYLPSTTGVTSIQATWGNDLTTKYWTSTAQTTQADGSAFTAGWNLLKFSWSAATETGTVAPATIDSFKIILNATEQNNIRVDNIIFSIGRNFDVKYYSKYLFKSSSGTYQSQPSADSDLVLVDNDSLPIFLFELLKDMAHQMEGTDSAFDIEYARGELAELYPAFRSEFPDQRKKLRTEYGMRPRFQ